MKKAALAIILGLLFATLFLGCDSQASSDNTIAVRDEPSQVSSDNTIAARDESSVDSQPDDGVDSNPGIKPLTEQDVADYFNNVASTYDRLYVFNALDEESLEPYHRFRFASMTSDHVVRYADLPEFLSDDEVEEYTQSLHVYYIAGDASGFDDYETLYFTVQYVEDMQKGIDELWGKQRIDIADMLEYRTRSGDAYLSENGVLIISYGYDPNRAKSYHEITKINMDGDAAKVFVHNVVVSGPLYSNTDGFAVDASDDRVIGDIVEKDWVSKNKNASFDEMVSQLGIDRRTLGEFEFTIRNTPDGPVLDGVEIIGPVFS